MNTFVACPVVDNEIRSSDSAEGSESRESSLARAVPPQSTHNAISATENALDNDLIRERIMLHLDPKSLLTLMAVSKAFHLSVERKGIQSELFFNSEKTSSVWIIDHKQRNITHERASFEPSGFQLHPSLPVGSIGQCIEHVLPRAVNKLLFPNCDSNIWSQEQTFWRFFPGRNGRTYTSFHLGIVPLCMPRNASCYKMLLTQPPVFRVHCLWVFVCKGPCEKRLACYRESTLTASTTRSWRMVDLKGNPLQLPEYDGGEGQYHIVKVPARIHNQTGVRFRDLVTSLHRNIAEAQRTGAKILGLVLTVPDLPAGQEDARQCAHIRASHITMHGLFTTTTEKENVESVVMCQAPRVRDDEDEIEEWLKLTEWNGESLAE